jgi:hypothetical protein
MSSEKSEIKRHLVTSGNFAFVATGTPLYKLVKTGEKFKKYYNVAPGQPVMWVESSTPGNIPDTIAPADLTLTDLANLKIGVGYSSLGNGMTDAIRLLSPLDVQGCTIDKLDATDAQCAVPWIKAVYPECVSCDTVSARVRVYDNQSISFSDHPLKAYQEFVGSYTPDCSSCNDCEKTATCDEVVCGLVDALNNDTDLRIQGDPYPHYYNTGLERPYTAFKIHNTWKSYCIAPEIGSGCTECNTIDALTSFTIDGEEYDFNLTDPASSGETLQTLVDQLEIAVDLINEKFTEVLGRHSGKAFLSRGEGKCCPVQLFVTTCDETFEIAGLNECESAVEQWPEFVTSGYCKQCGSTEDTTTPSCGIGVFVKPDVEPCNCWDLNQPKQFNSRWIEIDIISGTGNDNTPKYTKNATLLEGQVASNYGSQIQYLEYANNIDAIGFEGFQYEIGNEPSGWLGIPRKSSRLRKSITADCNKSYCTYYLRHKAQTEKGPLKTFINMFIDGYVHVPENDFTTKLDMNDLFAKFVELVPQECKVLTGASCYVPEV